MTLFDKYNLQRKSSGYLLAGLVAILLLLGGSYYLGKTTGSTQNYNDERPVVSEAKAKQELNKEFAFPLRDSTGKEVSKVKYRIDSVELNDNLIVKGQRVRSVQGRTFLVINVRITNPHNQAIDINTRDYVRLGTNGSSELLAPDVHNDPVQVQAISTKLTRVAFPINDSDKNLKLSIGEINGAKQTIDLNLPTK